MVILLKGCFMVLPILLLIALNQKKIAVNEENQLHKKMRRETAGAEILHKEFHLNQHIGSVVHSTNESCIEAQHISSLRAYPPPSSNDCNFPGIRTDWQPFYPVSDTWRNPQSQPVLGATADHTGSFFCNNSRFLPSMMNYPTNLNTISSVYGVSYVPEASVMTRESGILFPAPVNVASRMMHPQVHFPPCAHPYWDPSSPPGSITLPSQTFVDPRNSTEGWHPCQHQACHSSMISDPLEPSCVSSSQQEGNSSGAFIPSSEASCISNEHRLRKRKALARKISRLRFLESQHQVQANLALTVHSSELVYPQPHKIAEINEEPDESGAMVKPKKEEGGICSFRDLRRQAVESTLLTFEELRLSCLKTEEDRLSCEVNGFRRRADLKAATIMREKELWMNTQKVIGHIPGVQVGDCYNFRIELCILGLHRQHRAGIDFITAKNSAFNKSIATSVVIGKHDRYGDDMDMGETVIYTGQGGLPRKSKEGQIVAEDQRLVRGNIGLKNSYELHTPVRVIRGHRDKNKRSGTVYTYDGLYLVNDMKYEIGVAGNYVFKFLLERMKGQPPLRPISSRQAQIKSLPPPDPSTPLLLEGPQNVLCQSSLLNDNASKSPCSESSPIEAQPIAERLPLPEGSFPLLEQPEESFTQANTMAANFRRECPSLEASGYLPASSSSNFSSPAVLYACLEENLFLP
ncbi:hypothetical protein O6H91_19G000200 [Diphasiastrum complanatum]|uniref:Uncharacterized protein n=1 Tax=Diphasiastrum complanatum TaxID=34168 RepID=A0ACC2AS00_DIPCM|nr:hypothetical protein O6H91_19G000200 [Diphasiastrum complanatum]